MLEKKLTPEQLRERFEGWDKSIKSGAYENGGVMSHPVYRRRLGFVVLGGLYPQYEELSEEEKKNFGFDVEGLMKKIYNIFNQSLTESERYGDNKTLIKQEVKGRKINIHHTNEERAYWIPSDKCWISGKGISLNQAYRIFAEDDKVMEVREVQSFSERDEIVKELYAEIKRILKK